MAEQVNEMTGEIVPADIVTPSAIEAITRGEVDIQISTAKRFPRSIALFKKRAMELACFDEETAESCFYVLPRGGKKIEGPSIRMAEIAALCYGNIRVSGFVIDEGAEEIVARGMVHDLESNTAYAMDVHRRITDKVGKRFDRDMIVVTGNAATSIALRNAIFRVIPRAIIDQILETAKKVAKGTLETMHARRDKALEWFASRGIDEARVLARLERKGREEITLDDMVILSGLKTSLKDGEMPADELFPRPMAVKAPVFGAKGDEAKALPQTAAKPSGAPPSGTSPASAPQNPDGSLVDDGSLALPGGSKKQQQPKSTE